jgi:hypothetical protein
MDRIETLSLESEIAGTPAQGEELVVIAIIGVLIGLLLPSVQ